MDREEPGERPHGRGRRRPILFEFVVIFALVLMNAVFSGAEIAIVSVRRTRMEELAEEGNTRARAVLKLKAEPEQFLATVQIGITVVSAAAAAFGGATVATTIASALEPIGWLAPYAGRHCPGRRGARHFLCFGGARRAGARSPWPCAVPRDIALILARPLLFVSLLTRPFVRLLTWSSNLVLRPFRDRTTFTETKYSLDEIRQLVDEASKSGTVDVQAGEIATRALELEHVRARDVMIPRQEVVAIPRHAKVEEVHRICSNMVTRDCRSSNVSSTTWSAT